MNVGGLFGTPELSAQQESSLGGAGGDATRSFKGFDQELRDLRTTTDLETRSRHDDKLFGTRSTLRDPFNAREAVYSAKVLISDTAITFAGRAIVAPAAVQHRKDFAPPIAEPSQISIGEWPQALGPNDLRNGAVELGTLEPSFALPTVSIAGLVADKDTVRIGILPISALSLASPRMPIPSLTALTSAFGPARTQTDPSKTANTERSSLPQPLATLQTTSAIFAQLLAHPSEYRVVIRGQRLSENEREHFMRNVGAALTQLGLPFHPISVIFPESEG